MADWYDENGIAPEPIQRALEAIYLQQEAEETETRNKEFRAACDRRDRDLTHLRARPGVNPILTSPEEDGEMDWPGESEVFDDWFTVYDHMTDASIDSEARSVSNDTKSSIEQSPEYANALAWYVIPDDAPREDKIRRLVANHYPYDLDPYPISDIPVDEIGEGGGGGSHPTEGNAIITYCYPTDDVTVGETKTYFINGTDLTDCVTFSFFGPETVDVPNPKSSDTNEVVPGVVLNAEGVYALQAQDQWGNEQFTYPNAVTVTPDMKTSITDFSPTSFSRASAVEITVNGRNFLDNEYSIVCNSLDIGNKASNSSRVVTNTQIIATFNAFSFPAAMDTNVCVALNPGHNTAATSDDLIHVTD